MFGIGAPELIIIAIIISVVAVPFMAGRRGGISMSGPTLVLRKFNVDKLSPNGVFIEIIGRASGLTSWILTVLRFDTETTLKITKNEISFTSSSLFGQVNQLAPLSGVSSTLCGYSKPIGYLIAAGVFIIGGIIIGLSQRNGGPVLIFGIIIGIALIVIYALSKKIALSIETRGGRSLGLIFKRSVIENVSVDIEKALNAMEIINSKVLESQQKIALPG